MKRCLMWLIIFSIISASIMVFLSTTSTWNYNGFNNISLWTVNEKTKYQLSSDHLKQLIKISQHIVRAQRYSRSTIAMYELNRAFRTVNSLIDNAYSDTIIERLELINNAVLNFNEDKTMLPEVCPEIYMGMMYGYPYYYTGYITNNFNCTSQPIGDLLTVLLNVVEDINFDELETVLKGLSIYYPNVTSIIAYRKQDKDKFILIQKKYKMIHENSTEIDANDKGQRLSGKVWKELTKRATTKYIFVGRGLVHFDNHTSFERLLRFLSYTDVDIVGGSHRFVDGRWHRACYAMGVRNYTMKLVDGYDLSYNSCIYCDYISSPFVIRKHYFLDNLDESQDRDMLFVDFFTKMKNFDNTTTLVCPDVMFVVNEKQAVFEPFIKDNWLQYVIKWQLNRIVLPNKIIQSFSCDESQIKCRRLGGVIMPICCIQELLDMIKFLVKICEKNNIGLELEAGSGVGAAKMYGVTPYERDADFDFSSINHEKLSNLASEFSKHNYKLIPTPTNYSKCLKVGVNCGYFALKSKNWRLELWGANYLGSDEAFKVGLKHRTKVFIDGTWMTVLHSPAESARNEYGDDIFEHVEHWSTLGMKTGWVQPNTGNFLPCPTPGFHGCLDLYLPVGNIQFQDVWI